MEENAVVGIVGGAGPFAGVDLLKKIFDQTKASTDQEHLDVISIFKASKIMDRTEFLLKNGKNNPGISIAAQALELAEMGATVAAIPCNTAHSPKIFDCILSELDAHDCKIKFLNMIQEVVKHLQQYDSKIKKVGVLSTTGTYKTQIYPHYLNTHGYEVAVPTLSIQERLVHQAIYSPEYGIKALGKGSSRTKEDLITAIRLLKLDGAEAIILGCTEIPLAFEEYEIQGLPIIDPTLILARALISEVDPAKLKPYIY